MGSTAVSMLAKIAQVLVPALPAEAAELKLNSDERAARIYEFPGQDADEMYLQCAEEALTLAQTHLPKEKLTSLRVILWILSTRIGSFLLCGRYALSWLPPFCQSFQHMPRSQCEAAMLSWKASSLAPLRQVFKALHGLVAFTFFSMHNNGKNSLWDVLGYPGADPHRPSEPSKAKQMSEKILLDRVVDAKGSSLDQLSHRLQSKGLKVENEPQGGLQLTCDAVVVGSGCGGSVTAAILAHAGLKVIVVEKGGYTPAAELSTLERDAYDSMYEKGGVLMASEDGSMIIMAGSTVGGGSRINWSVSFRTPDHVRRDWANTYGLPKFQTDEYTAALDAVCQRLGVQTGVKHNKANSAMWRGLEACSFDVEEMPRNCSKSASCGHCPHGCASGYKQDATATYLADAAEHGATILTGCFAKSISTEQCGTGVKEKRATGVALHVLGNPALKIKINAPTVVASSGSLHSPALLLRSGITCRGNVGKHLHLHPATSLAIEFPQKDIDEDKTEGRIHVWEGPQMSTYSREIANWQTTGYGPLVSMTSAHPGLLAAASPWNGAVAFRRNISRLPWMAASCVYVRDLDSGTVSVDKEGQPIVNYWPSPHDQNSILAGLQLSARAMLAAGAARLVSNLYGLRKSEVSVERAQDGSILNSKEVDSFVDKIKSAGLHVGRDNLFSLHQMGSCRMGASPETSVIDPQGECWECSGLYVADASSFPTATGVNPMITAYAISFMTAQGIAQRWRGS